MPLYMDFHILPDVTIEDVKKAHMADKTVQDHYGVKYHQFWINQDTGSVFCLMEGPDEDSCAATHREAHGTIACNIVEVETGMFSHFMGENLKTDQGAVLANDGSIDAAYRYVVAINIYGNTQITPHKIIKSFIFPVSPKNWFWMPCQNFTERKSETSTTTRLSPYLKNPKMP